MSNTYKKKSSNNRDMPEEFNKDTVSVIDRIECKENVVGVLYFRNDVVQMYTVPEPMGIVLANRLPRYTAAVHRAVSEIDALDQVVAFRIETKLIEIIVAPGSEFAACVVNTVKKGKPKKPTKKSLKQ